jgi:hypothetical protein
VRICSTTRGSSIVASRRIRFSQGGQVRTSMSNRPVRHRAPARRDPPSERQPSALTRRTPRGYAFGRVLGWAAGARPRRSVLHGSCESRARRDRNTSRERRPESEELDQHERGGEHAARGAEDVGQIEEAEGPRARRSPSRGRRGTTSGLTADGSR